MDPEFEKENFIRECETEIIPMVLEVNYQIFFLYKAILQEGGGGTYTYCYALAVSNESTKSLNLYYLV